MDEHGNAGTAAMVDGMGGSACAHKLHAEGWDASFLEEERERKQEQEDETAQNLTAFTFSIPQVDIGAAANAALRWSDGDLPSRAQKAGAQDAAHAVSTMDSETLHSEALDALQRREQRRQEAYDRKRKYGSTRKAIPRSAERKQKLKEKYTPAWLTAALQRDASLLLFKPDTRIRDFCNKVTRWPLFEWIILLHVLATMVYFALLDEYDTSRPAWHVVLGFYFFVVFLIEWILRVVRRGLWVFPTKVQVYKKYGRPYLRYLWYWVDTLVIIAGVISLCVPHSESFKALRAVRVLVPLKTLYAVPTMRFVLNGFLAVLPRMLQVLGFCLVILLIFSQIGLRMFLGRFHQYCTDGVNMFVSDEYPDGVLCGYIQCSNFGPDLVCAVGLPPEDPTNIFQAPNFGFSNFDNIFYSSLTTFTAVTMEGWTETMYFAMYTTTPWSAIFFVLIVFIGAYFVVNLVVAVIADVYLAFFQQMNEEQIQMLEESDAEMDEDVSETENENLKSLCDNGPAQLHAGAPCDPASQPLTQSSLQSVAQLAEEAKSPEAINASAENLSSSVHAGCRLRAEQDKAHTNSEVNLVNLDANPESQSTRGENHVQEFVQKGSSGFAPPVAVQFSSIRRSLSAVSSEGLSSEGDNFAVPARIRTFVASVWSGIKRGYIALTVKLLFLKPAREWTDRYITSQPAFEWFISFSIFAMTVVLATYHEGMSESWFIGLRVADFVFQVIFLIEMVLLIFVLGPVDYCKDGWNLLAGIINIVTWIVMIVGFAAHGKGIHQSSGIVTSLKSLRLIRLVYAVRHVPVVTHTLVGVLNCMRYLIWLIPLFLLFWIIFAIIGKVAFGGEFFGVDNRPCNQCITDQELMMFDCTRHTWSTIGIAVVDTFQILTGEDWQFLMYEAMAAVSVAVFLYFVVAFVVLDYLLLNIFLTFVLFWFDAGISESAEVMARLKRSLSSFWVKVTGKWRRRCAACVGMDSSADANLRDDARGELDTLSDHFTDGSVCSDDVPYSKSGPESSAFKEKGECPGNLIHHESLEAREVKTLDASSEQVSVMQQGSASSEINAGHSSGVSPILNQPAKAPTRESKQQSFRVDAKACAPSNGPFDSNFHVNALQPPTLQMAFSSFKSSNDLPSPRLQRRDSPRGTVLEFIMKREECSFFLFSPRNPVRRFCRACDESWLYNAFQTILLIYSCVLLVIYAPENSLGVQRFLHFSFVAVLVLIAQDFLLRSISRGLILNKTAYLRSVWAWLDLLVLIYLLVELAIDHEPLRLMALVFVLRSTRVYSIMPGLRMVAKSLLLVIFPCMGVTVIVFLIYLIFGLWGLFLFAGRYNYCECPDGSYPDCNTALIADVPNAAAMCVAMGGQWLLYPANFNNIGITLRTLFEVATLENWLPIMYTATDSCGFDKGPKLWCSPTAAIYFILFVFFGSMFSLNLYVSTVIDAYMQVRKDQDGLSILTSEQREWFEWQRIVLSKDFGGGLYRPPRRLEHTYGMAGRWNRFRIASFRSVRSNAYTYVLDLLVLANTVLLCIEYWRWSRTLQLVYLILACVLTGAFVFDRVLTVVGYGRVQFLGSTKELVETAVVCTMVADCITRGLVFDGILVIGPEDTLVYYLLALRAVAVLRLLRYTKTIRRFAVQMLLSFSILANVLLLLLYVFYVFAFVGVLMFGSIPVPVPNPPVNGGGVQTFACFRNFGIAMLTLIRTTTGEAWNAIMWDIISLGGAYSYAWIYFYLFIVISSFTIINLFVAVIIELYSGVVARDAFKVTDDMIADFTKIWNRYDPDRTRSISVVKDLRALLRECEPPLGVGKEATTAELFDFLERMDPKVDEDGRISFYDCLHSLLRLRYQEADRSFPETIREQLDATPVDSLGLRSRFRLATRSVSDVADELDGEGDTSSCESDNSDDGKDAEHGEGTAHDSDHARARHSRRKRKVRRRSSMEEQGWRDQLRKMQAKMTAHILQRRAAVASKVPMKEIELNMKIYIAAHVIQEVAHLVLEKQRTKDLAKLVQPSLKK
ncbi:Sodium channel protein type 11 subunit alpha [Porphyridium purpureum]|uniref:Sodium channel protein type 11 subunit alpha n=1 Tax=Porphyridium purpureum TaxID=35688 RepID=A0A5J4YQM2_PORPP|nr:Sodium channel protein type 11 subunit alpha [Porphyridium purpureum]|eukprot:POR3396..scf296_7